MKTTKQDRELKTRINNSLMFEVKYLPCTNTRGSRVKVTTWDLAHRNNDKPKSIILSYDHTFNSSSDIAQYWLETNKFKVIAKNCRKNEADVFICKWDFETLCKAFKISVEA